MAQLLQSTPWDEVIRSKPFAAGLGLLSHVLLNNGEYDHSAHILASLYVFAFGAVTAVEYAVDPRVHSISQALRVSGTTAAVYFTSLFTSILIYRAFFHRLRKFPGPFLARLSKFYILKLVLPDCQLYFEIEKLHKEYNSDIVRTGPRELSIISADAIPLIHGPMSQCRKSEWYDGSKHLEGYSTQTTRSKQEHKERRKAWDRAFSIKSLREYEPRVNRHSRMLMERLREHADEPSVRISSWANFYSFDVMGDIGFSRSFGMLEKGEEDELITKLHKSMAPVSVFGQLNWLLCLTMHTLGAKNILDFMAWTSKVLKERKKIIPKENDVFGWLLDPNEEDIPLQLNADARLMIIAGSDTTAATLTWLFYELCKNPSALTTLQKAVDDIAPEKYFLDADDLTDCPYLDGVIHETMRLHPAVPSGVQRETPPSGITLPDQTFIPGSTLIWMPIHTIQRSPKYYRDPLTFYPSRWTAAGANYILDKRAYMPFSTGAYNCVGQKLAIMEMRSVAANLVRQFDVQFAEGEDGGSCERKTRDCFTLIVGGLDVRLTRRERGGE